MKKKCLQCGKTLKKQKNLYIRKYCSHICQKRFQREILVKSGKAHHTTLKRYLLDHLGNVCSVCLNEVWNGKAIPLVIDHIDGNPYNNILENVRLICCNCDAQTSTYKGKNRGNGRHYRKVRYAEGKSF